MRFVLAFLIGFLPVWWDRDARLNRPDALVFNERVFYLQDDSGLEGLFEAFQADSVRFDSAEVAWVAHTAEFSRFLAGRYEVDSLSTVTALLDRMSRGHQDPFLLTIPPGATWERIRARLDDRMRFTAAEFDSTVSDSAFLAEMGITRADVHGRLLPESYEVFWTDPPATVLRRINQVFRRQVVEPYAARLDSLGWTVDQALTLASIIELEVYHTDEKPRVSGLYWNRLRIGMPLQADPTVAFAVGERRRLFYSDYRVNHPYNTYRFRGLPPGAITNPRLGSIRAALYPEQHQYLYMVARGDGYHTFTRTYSEHQAEARKWRRILRERLESR